MHWDYLVGPSPLWACQQRGAAATHSAVPGTPHSKEPDGGGGRRRLVDNAHLDGDQTVGRVGSTTVFTHPVFSFGLSQPPVQTPFHGNYLLQMT